MITNIPSTAVFFGASKVMDDMS